MDKLALQKMAVEVRKGIVSSGGTSGRITLSSRHLYLFIF